MNQDTRNIIALTMVEGLGTKSIVKLIRATSCTEDIFNMTDLQLKKITGRKLDLKNGIREIRRKDIFLSEIDFIEKEGIKAVSLLDDAYPVSLKNIYDPPPVLFVKGDMSSLVYKSVAVVGSRRCSLYGLNVSEKLSYSLAEKGLTVVSGLARGIDTAAHKGALRSSGKTIAVLGSGFRNIYPPESEKLIGEICIEGAVITEYPSFVKPSKGTFPRRNRIISGLSEGVLVVEAGHKSGAMITANMALDQGKEVFAVPGRVDSYVSKGTNHLIQSGAKLVIGVDDILEELGAFSYVKVNKKTQENKPDITVEKKIYDILSGNDLGLHFDDISEKSDIHHSQLSEILLKMECSGSISMLAGRRFILKKQQ